MRAPRFWTAALLLAPVLLTFAPLSAGGAQTRRITVLLRGYERPVMLDSLVATFEIAEPAGHVFHAAVKVLDELKMPRTDVDSAHGLLANRSLTARTRFAEHPMSWAIQCGTGLTGDYADTWRVSMAWVVYIDSIGPARTRIGIAVLAGANNVEGAYKPPVACGSTGSLESEIAKRIKVFLLTY